MAATSNASTEEKMILVAYAGVAIAYTVLFFVKLKSLKS
jgi:hypothetical protein